MCLNGPPLYLTCAVDEEIGKEILVRGNCRGCRKEGWGVTEPAKDNEQVLLARRMCKVILTLYGVAVLKVPVMRANAVAANLRVCFVFI